MAHKHGQLVIEHLLHVENAMTENDIVKHLSDLLGVRQKYLRLAVQRTLKTGVEHGFIHRDGHKYFVEDSAFQIFTTLKQAMMLSDSEGENYNNYRYANGKHHRSSKKAIQKHGSKKSNERDDDDDLNYNDYDDDDDDDDDDYYEYKRYGAKKHYGAPKRRVCKHGGRTLIDEDDEDDDDEDEYKEYKRNLNKKNARTSRKTAHKSSTRPFKKSKPATTKKSQNDEYYYVDDDDDDDDEDDDVNSASSSEIMFRRHPPEDRCRDRSRSPLTGGCRCSTPHLKIMRTSYK